MNHLLSVGVILGLVLTGPVFAKESVNVFACEPEWAALAKEIAGDEINVFTATTARQDPHFVRAKPSLIAAMRKADLVICSGASLEIGWLPILLQKAGKASMQPGAVGFVMAADFVPMLEKPVTLDRSQGDIHPEGNPHVHLNPHNISLVAKELAERLQKIDVRNAGAYRARHSAFSGRWEAALKRWEQDAKDLNGAPVIVHHKAFSYLIDWLGMKQAATLEARPGIPPTTSHLENLLQTLKANPARWIIRTPYDPADASTWLSRQTGTATLILPYTVGGDAQSDTLFALFESSIRLLKGEQRD